MEYDPNLSHLTSSHYERVYEPSEDTFLMCTALYQQKDYLHQHFSHTIAPLSLEIGSGSGMLLAYLAAIMNKKGIYIATDINSEACKATKDTLRLNGVSADVICCDLIQPLQPKLSKHIDILLFNPPYVPTPSDELGSDGIEAAWAGGERGREIIDRIFNQLDEILSNIGIFYCVVLKANDPNEIVNLMKDKGFNSEV